MREGRRRGEEKEEIRKGRMSRGGEEQQGEINKVEEQMKEEEKEEKERMSGRVFQRDRRWMWR